jgi:hypothetical protein
VHDSFRGFLVDTIPARRFTIKHYISWFEKLTFKGPKKTSWQLEVSGVVQVQICKRALGTPGFSSLYQFLCSWNK